MLFLREDLVDKLIHFNKILFVEIWFINENMNKILEYEYKIDKVEKKYYCLRDSYFMKHCIGEWWFFLFDVLILWDITPQDNSFTSLKWSSAVIWSGSQIF